MKTPFLKIVLIVAAMFMISACEKDSSGGGAGETPKDAKVALKNPGVKTVLIDSVADLNKYIVAPENVTAYKITEGEQAVEWTDEFPKIHFIQAGTVKVIATNAESGSFVEIEFKVTFDTTGLEGPDENPELEVPDNPVIHL